MYYIGKHTIDYYVPEMRFQDVGGKEVVLMGFNTYPKQVISSHSMRSLLRHGDIEWVFECLVSTKGTSFKVAQYLEDIQNLLGKYKGVFGDLPHGRPLDILVEHKIELEIGTSPENCILKNIQNDSRMRLKELSKNYLTWDS